jgi:nicotinate phosphoribosyltransferase
MLKSYNFPDDFLEYLKAFRFTGTISSSHEGDVVFPTRPILQVEGSLLEAQLVETLVLNMLNFQTLIATKASRMRQVAGGRKLLDFGLRRAHGSAGYYASRAAIIGGFDATSNVRAGRDFHMPVSGTMAHSFIQSYDDELTAFRKFAETRPEDCIFLVDTYDTLKSGIPNAIKVGKEMETRGNFLKGVRLDSGDLAYLSKISRQMLDEAGLNYVKIAVSNQLDEYLIKSLIEQGAPIDVFGVGTCMVTGQPDAALDGVYKLAYSGGKSRLKLSENIEKVSLPDKKQVYRLKDKQGAWIGADAVSLFVEKEFDQINSPFDDRKSMMVGEFQKEPLLKKVMENGKKLADQPTIEELSLYRQKQMGLLPEEFKRFEYPHTYKIGISNKLKNKRNQLVRLYQPK